MLLPFEQTSHTGLIATDDNAGTLQKGISLLKVLCFAS